MNPKTIRAIVITIGAFATLTIGHGCAQSEATRREAIKAGLSEQPTGGGTTVWVKP